MRLNSGKDTVTGRQTKRGLQVNCNQLSGTTTINNHRPILNFLLLTLLTILFVGCSPEELLNPPRVATQTVQAAQLQTLLVSPVPSPTNEPFAAPTPVPTKLLTVADDIPDPIIVWLNETDAATIALAEAVGSQFTAQSGVQVQFVYLPAQKVTELAGTAKLTQQLPDLILHTNEQTAGLVADGVLDSAAANELIQALGPETFMQGVLPTVQQIDDEYVAVPSDGWQYLLLYRQDWFTAAGLAPPTTFDALLAGADTFYNFDNEELDRGDLVSGIVVPTEQDGYSTQRVFEWVATANGCRIVDNDGFVGFMHPACLASLEFYRSLVNQYSPPDYQTDVTAFKAYLDGRTAMIMAPPSILPMLAGYDPDYTPTCAACAENPNFLVENTGFTTQLTGQSDFATAANFALMTLWGITVDADPVATDFLSLWYEASYLDWIALAPERRVPLRVTNGDGVDQLVAWREMPLRRGEACGTAACASAETLFTPQITDLLLNDLPSSERWNDGVLRTTIYEQLTIAPILQRMLSGYVGSSQATVDTQNALLAANQVAPLIIDVEH